jgi:hypothetical protein
VEITGDTGFFVISVYEENTPATPLFGGHILSLLRSAWSRGRADEDDYIDEELQVQGKPRLHRGCAPLVEGPLQQVTGGTPTSASADRVFSMLKAMFGNQATTALANYIQTAIMLRSNKRKVG